jgi:hypothetical protein
MGFNRNMPLGFRPNIHRRSRPAAFVCRTRLPKTSALLQHIRQNGRLGQMMWTALQWTQVTVGVGFAISPNLGGSYLTQSAVTFSLREFLASSEVYDRIANTYTVCPPGP